MKRLRVPTPLLRLASFVAIGFAVWLLLIPRTALYYVDDEGAYDVETTYGWGKSNQMMMLPGELVDSGASGKIALSVRVHCGTAFTPADHPPGYPAVDDACGQVETPRRIIGIGLAVLGVAGFVIASRLDRRREAEWAAWVARTEGRPAGPLRA